MPHARPRYIEIADKFTEMIRSGQLKPGDKLPSTAELASQEGVSTATATRAMALLHDRKLVIGRQGKGVYVL